MDFFSFSILANLSKLRDIDLSNNELEVETETPTWIPSFQLASLNLMNCKLNKKNGHIIPSFISNQHKLRALSLAYNSLQGKIPSWLLYNNSPSVILSLRGNSFNDEFPIFSASFQRQISSLVLLDISANNIFGQIPSNIGNLFPALHYLNMSRNALQGIIPLSLGNMSMLRVLDASFSFLNGKISEKLRQNNTSLFQLILSDNNLHGEIMPVFSNMTKLAYLHLRNNGFIGTFSAPMVNMPILKVLEISGNQFSGNIPNWLADHPRLHVLLLARNDFHGGIPLSLCKMQNLHILDLSVNHLSGVLPSCLCNITAWKKGTEVSFISDMVFPITYSDYELNGLFLSYQWLPNISTDFRVEIPFRTKGNSMNYEGLPLSLMTGIDLSVNNLSGAIPSEIGELLMLRSLNLSCNNLTGKFPESFKNLKNLESLDLSHNHLVGTLPRELVQLCSLSTFSVAFNNLSGKIPYKNNFLTFNETSYIGNSGFCALPLNDNCSVSRLPQIPDGHDKDDGEGIGESDLFFFSCVAVFYMCWDFGLSLPL